MKQGVLFLLALWSLTGAAGASPGPTDAEVARMQAAAPARPAVRPRRPRRVLVFSRNEGFAHTAIPYGARAVRILGEKTGAFSTTESEDLAVLTPARLRAFDAIFINNGYGYRLDPPARQALLTFVRNGKGLVGIHAASANFEGWPEGTQLFGARFENHPWTPKAEWAVRNDDPRHPLTAAFAGSGFRVRDEIYAFTDVDRAGLRVLLSLDLSDPVTAAEPHDDAFVPVSWVRRVGKGRVFFCSLGHEHDLFWTPAFLKHLLDGIQFALGDLPADATPNPPPAPDADPDAPFAALLSAPPDDLRQPLDAISAQVRAARSSPARAALEQRLLRVLQSEAGTPVKRAVLAPLSQVATDAAVPVVAPLLGDPDLSHGARLVLERVGSAAARSALRSALARTTGRVQAGIISSLADLRDPASVPLLQRLASDADGTVAEAALRALGHIGTPESAQALAGVEVPSPLLPALADARATCAERLAAGGRRRDAETIYESPARAGATPGARTLGLRGLVALRSSRAAPLVFECLEHGDPSLRHAAAMLAPRLAGRDAAQRLRTRFPALPGDLQEAVLRSLVDAKAAGARPLILAGLSSDDDRVCDAAIQAAQALAGAEAVPRLAELAGQAGGAHRQRAREALARLRGPGVDAAILRRARTANQPVRAALFGVLADRQHVPALPVLLEAAHGSDPALAADALSALGRLARRQDLADVVRLLLSTPEGRVREAAQDALVTAARRLGNPDRTLQPVFAALPDAPPPAKAALLGVLAEVGGERALAEVTRAAESADPDVRRTAVTALAEGWEDTRALPVLLRIARSERENAVRVQALRGYLRLLGIEAQTRPDDVVARLGEALALAWRPEEKRLALSIVRECRVPAAVTLAAQCLEDPALRAEAADAIRALAAPRRQGNVERPAVGGPATSAALRKAVELAGQALPAPWQSADVGSVAALGWASYAGGTFTLIASGSDFWQTADGGHFVWQRLSGDVTITARVDRLDNTNPWAKAGVMFRETLDAGARCIFLCVSPESGSAFQWRAQTGGECACILSGPGVAPPYWVRLSRTGDVFTAFLSQDGRTWRELGKMILALPTETLVGLAASSHQDGIYARADLSSVTIGP